MKYLFTISSNYMIFSLKREKINNKDNKFIIKLFIPNIF